MQKPKLGVLYGDISVVSVSSRGVNPCIIRGCLWGAYTVDRNFTYPR